MLRIFSPQVYQGPRRLAHKGYFEGWYYKFVTKQNRSIALIPGISLGKNESKAFIQIIDGKDGSSDYFSFPVNEFNISYDPFSVEIEGNRFSLEEVSLSGNLPVTGRVSLIDPGSYPVSLLRPGIMGWYRYVPFMECYHGVVSMGHRLSGQFLKGDEVIDLNSGSGYIEKDWGTSFPTSYIWMQTNSFSSPGTSFLLSLARIPWLGSWFRGFLGFFLHEGELITFSTYTGSYLEVHNIEKESVSMTIRGKGRGGRGRMKKEDRLVVSASRKAAGELKAPVIGSMERRISESIDGLINLKFYHGEQLVFHEESPCSGLEIVGDKKELF